MRTGLLPWNVKRITSCENWVITLKCVERITWCENWVITLNVLKSSREPLMPLINNMTYIENLIGFNSGGYKALSYSLNIQVLLTETTLFTPRRCFEKVAEECYDDSLSSITASCSWDKHVAVETGSQIDSHMIRRRLDLIRWVEWMSTTFCTWSVVLVEPILILLA